MIVTMTDSSKKRNCEGSFWNAEFMRFWKVQQADLSQLLLYTVFHALLIMLSMPVHFPSSPNNIHRSTFSIFRCVTSIIMYKKWVGKWSRKLMQLNPEFFNSVGKRNEPNYWRVWKIWDTVWLVKGRRFWLKLWGIKKLRV